MAAMSKVDETVKALRGFKSPAQLAEHFGIIESAARARIKAVEAAGHKLESKPGDRNGDRGRFPTLYRVASAAPAKG